MSFKSGYESALGYHPNRHTKHNRTKKHDKHTRPNTGLVKGAYIALGTKYNYSRRLAGRAVGRDVYYAPLVITGPRPRGRHEGPYYWTDNVARLHA